MSEIEKGTYIVVTGQAAIGRKAPARAVIYGATTPSNPNQEIIYRAYWVRGKGILNLYRNEFETTTDHI